MDQKAATPKQRSAFLIKLQTNGCSIRFVTILSLMVISSSALAENENERISKEMLIILQSKEVAALMSEVDGAKKFKEIKLVSTSPAYGGLATYKLIFNFRNSDGVFQICDAEARILTKSSKIMNFTPIDCYDRESLYR